MDISHLVQHQKDWSSHEFGEGLLTERVLKHIEKEIAEVRAKPEDLGEWIDIVLLALDGAWRTGASSLDIQQALVDKLAINEGRKWQKPADENEPFEHVR